MQKLKWYVAALFALVSSSGMAQVHKCIGPTGITSYSDIPCTAAGAEEQILTLKIPPASISHTTGEKVPASENWKAQEEAFQTRWKERVAENTQGSKAGGRQRKSDKQISAECEANRGTKCDASYTIDNMREDQTPLTKEEQQAVINSRRNQGRGSRF